MFVDNEIARASLKASPADETDHPDGLIRNFNLGSALRHYPLKWITRGQPAIPLDAPRSYIYIYTNHTHVYAYSHGLTITRECVVWKGENAVAKAVQTDAIKTNQYHYYPLKVWFTIKYLVYYWIPGINVCVFFNANNLLVYRHYFHWIYEYKIKYRNLIQGAFWLHDNFIVHRNRYYSCKDINTNNTLPHAHLATS